MPTHPDDLARPSFRARAARRLGRLGEAQLVSVATLGAGAWGLLGAVLALEVIARQLIELLVQAGGVAAFLWTAVRALLGS